MADPWLKFYTADWRNEPRLRMCSMAARGLWIELICLMHEASPYGQLIVGGHIPTDAQLAVLVGTTPDELAALLGELESAGVFSRTKQGVIYSRKMSRMAKKEATARNNGRKGGNPRLRSKTVNPASDNPQVRGGDKPQKQETRNQIESNTEVSPSIIVTSRMTARERDDDDAPPPENPNISPTDRERLLEAIGLDPSGLTGHGGRMLGTRADMEIAERWSSALGLSIWDQVEVIREVMARKTDGPPASFKYFTKAMEHLAATRAEPDPSPTGGNFNGPRDYAEERRRRANERLARIIDAAAHGIRLSPQSGGS